MMTSTFPEGDFNSTHDPTSTGTLEKQNPGQTDSDAEPPYSVFHRRQLGWIIAIAAFAGWFSSASSFIYFPAIPFMARDLGISVEKVNLTVTSYLVASGIFPSVTGSAADIYGRKPVLIVSLGAYTVVNIGLALQRNFVALFILRMAQSVAISGTVSIGYGVMGDVTTPATRGGYSGMLSLFINTPPSVAPLISGLLLIRWTWPAIFWLLSVLSPIALLAVVLFLPETCRNIVGNGSLPPPRLGTAILPHLKPPTNTHAHGLLKSERRFPNPIKIFLLLRHRGSLVAVCCFGVAYSVYSCLQASLSSVFVDIYGVSGVTAGLIYIPFGVACMISAVLAGRLLDRDYAVTAQEEGKSVDRVRGDDLTSFPVEKARLRNSKFSIILLSALIIGYGWALHAETHMAVPLVLQFFIGFLYQFVFTTLHTLIIDYNPNDSSSIQAASNFVRCELAAALLGVLDRMFKSLGLGWTFVIIGGLQLVILPVLWVLEDRGLQWRSKKGVAESGTP